MTIAKTIATTITKSSWIRKMFEEGARLKAEHGPENVYDFSLGNPNLPPPDQFSEVLAEVATTCQPGDHCYMPNTGYQHVCDAVAEHLSVVHDTPLTCNEVLMTCGAAGGLNVIFKTILNPGEEVIVPAPFFVEYNFYTANHGGTLKPVPAKPDFTLDLEAIENAISAQTKAVLVNSPNNPTGQVYSRESLSALGELLKKKSAELNKTIYLVSDEPYRNIIYDGVEVPSIFGCYSESLITSSYSKDISIPGERLGYVLVHPQCTYRSDLLAGLALSNRILGYVNATALIQRVVAQIQGITVDMTSYTRNRELFCDGLADCGFEFIKPGGAFYLFPRSPIADDVKFVRELQKELILAVPGSGFGGPGHFRLAFCVHEKTITGALPGFKKVMQQFE